MGWNDHDDRLQSMADCIESYGVEYTKAYEMALDIRTDEMLGGDLISEDALASFAFDLMENAE